jgi:OmcA/MtrC family decaheme c-type cytochrome
MSLVIIAVALALASCAGTPGPEGPAGPVGPVGPAGPAGPAGADAVMPVSASTTKLETCSICHTDSGAAHQASYDELYQEGVITVTDVTYAFVAPNKHTVTFKMAKNGAPFNAGDAESVGIYYVPFDGTAFQFDPPLERLNMKGTVTCDGFGKCTSILEGEGDMYAVNYLSVNGMIVIYGRDETVGTLPARVNQAKYPFAAILETGAAGVDYISAANDAGCSKCHSDPYAKHGYILGELNDDPATDFLTCKACHLDNGEGGHFEWQLLVDDPAMAAAYLADETVLTPDMAEQYAYTTSLMNDVHMSHAMEFPYPQSMSTCATCHDGKLDSILSDANFTVETCKSCHPVTGSVVTEGEETLYDTTTLALKTISPSPLHDSVDFVAGDCASCHSEEGVGPTLSEIHNGYDKMIYATAGLKYADAIVVTVDEASFADNKLTIKFSAAEDPDIDGLAPADIVPSVMVGLYGWDTKDYIIGPHERLVDDNGDGEVGSGDERALEYVVAAEHPRFTTVSAAGGSWEVVADLSTWADLIADGTVKRVEIAVMPELQNADGVILALDAPSRTFDLGINDFADDFYGPITKVEGCESCHDALATNYHSPDRGGNVVVCRMCHVTKSGGSHLELQSRSIDSYVHAIHSSQQFDVGDINFADPVEAMHYDHHIEFPYPTHGITDCESCHEKGTYEAPDQSMSLPGILSASDSNETWSRNIGSIPSVVTGPATRACGACHRAELINEDSAGGLAVLNQHFTEGGYQIESGEDAGATLQSVIDQVMGLFK